MSRFARPETETLRRRKAWLAFASALLLGLGSSFVLFPLDFLWPRAGGAWRPVGDAAQHMIAQRYLIAEPWAWPPPFAATLNTQEGGMNTAFADSIPLLALLLKAVRGLLPEGFHGVGLFYGLACVAQPIAAIWALRGAGERRLLPALGVALAASAMPAFLGRFGHAALTGHFLLLLGLGLYFRLVLRPTPGLWAAAVLLQPAALLIHPYLAIMTLALAGAVPATRLLRGEAFIGAGLLVGLGLALVVGVMAAFGYLGAQGDGGYGMFAMNLLSPVWPAGSGLAGWPWAPQLDATGHGGWEGYNWLGFGVLGALAAGLLARPAGAWRALGRHPGLLVVALALTALAVTHRVGFGERIILDLGTPPAMLEQFRASGRLFWPVAYGLLVAGFAALAKAGRLGPALCLVAGLVQFADAAPLRQALGAWAARQDPWRIEAEALRAELATATRLTLLPSWPCVAPDAADRGEIFAGLLEVLALASERAVPASTMYVARWRTPPVCSDTALAAAPLAEGEVRLLLPASAGLLARVPGGDARCRPIGELTACR